MLVRYCMTYHHYNLYFIMSHIFLLYHENSTPPLHPTWPGLGGVHLSVNPSLLVTIKYSNITLEFGLHFFKNCSDKISDQFSIETNFWLENRGPPAVNSDFTF